MLHLILTLLITAAVSVATANIQIINSDEKPIAGATVLIGTAPGEPFEGNVLDTDVNGELSTPKLWTDHLPMTIEAEGYVRTTFPSVHPVSGQFIIQRADGVAKLEVKGDTIGYGKLHKDGKVDFSLVFPALQRSQLLQFDISSIISPELDTLKIITKKLRVPSNFSLPEQTETYMIPITINKPQYRMFVRQPGDYRMTAIHGQFPLKRVISDIQDGKSYFDVINHFKFFGGGQKDVMVDGHIDGQNIAIDQIAFSETVAAIGPVVPEGQYAVSLAMVQKDGLLYPTDLKRLVPNQTQTLQVPVNTERFILTLLTEDRDLSFFDIIDIVNGPDTDENLLTLLNFKVMTETDSPLSGSISLALQTTPVSQAPKFLELVGAPIIEGETVRLSPPQTVPGVTPLATLVILSEVDKGAEADTRAETRTRLWEFQAEGWVTEVNLPQWPLNLNPNKTHRWEMLYLGTTEKNIATNPLDSVTHLTRNSIEF